MRQHKKIFVLGLSRTGTTSLHAAFILMGFGSVHYHANAARYWLAGNFNKDMMEHFDACTDLPTPLYYPQLDARYPGSKFILLERDTEQWLDSVKRQWQTASKSSNKTLIRDMIRVAVYGTTRFNESRMRYVYKIHSQNTKEYFKNRPDDFITFNVTEGDGWDKLCNFLHCKPPDDIHAFPRLRTPYIGSLVAVKNEDVKNRRQEILALIEGRSDKVQREIPEA